MNYLNMNASFNNWIAVDIRNDEIIDVANNRKIGVVIEKYKELENISMEYYNKLIEAGIIEKEKTPEEIAKEQNELISNLYKEIKSMQQEIRSLKDVELVKTDVTDDNITVCKGREPKTADTSVNIKSGKSNKQTQSKSD